jgi:putative DNA primase/helicase
VHEFRTVMIASGLRPRDVIADGKWYRCPTDDHPRKRNGAYLLAIDGRAGWFKNFALDDGFNVWRLEGEFSPAQRAKAEADVAAARRREAEHRQASIKACRAYWASLKPARGGHPYLEGKQLDMLGCGQLRIDGELLVVPVMRDGQVMSVQTIAPDGQKRFRPGCPVKGGTYLLERQGATMTCFVEGLATGLAVFSSLRQARVFVCFDAGNLVEVATHFRGFGLGVVCADNDHETAERIGTNKGLEAGHKAAELLGCGVAFPEGIRGSDWADAITEREDGRRWVARQITNRAKPFKYAERAMA